MITNLIDGFIGVEVPEDATDFMILGNPGAVDGIFKGLPEHYNLYANGIYNTPLVGLYFQDNKYKIIGKADELTMQKWVEIIGHFYEPKEYMKSKSLNPNTTLIIQKL